ncbi:branched-chain amino acid ABC transporter permease [Ruminococcaceae bacterium OttesenSCG-928-A11]|nr:branched-chain amino acid ABC transporter permease [Ruminococcaceae bacterium OttesenSCG-928-A11]
MTKLIQQIITGLSIGGIYSLLAVGYALIYSIFDFTNFAFGALMMMGAFACFFAISYFGMPLWLAFIVVIAFSIILSVFVELVAYRPMRNKGSSRLFLMIAAMGVDIFIVNIMTVFMGGNIRMIDYKMPVKTITFAGISVGFIDILAMGVCLVILVVLWLFLDRTMPGIAIRASAYDTITAGLMGVNTNVISLLVFSISGFASGVAGVFFGFKYAVYPAMGGIATKAFIASVIGGLGSLPGAVVGGLLLGVLETMVSGYISSTYRDLFSYGLLVIMLLFLPNGLLGKSSKEKS